MCCYYGLHPGISGKPLYFSLSRLPYHHVSFAKGRLLYVICHMHKCLSSNPHEGFITTFYAVFDLFISLLLCMPCLSSCLVFLSSEMFTARVYGKRIFFAMFTTHSYGKPLFVGQFTDYIVGKRFSLRTFTTHAYGKHPTCRKACSSSHLAIFSVF